MGETTAIEWTDHTANFWMGCTKVSPGCTHCYAETLTTNRMGLKVWGPNSTRQVGKAVWGNVVKWNRAAREAGERKKCFVMSLGDFGEDHPIANEHRPRAWKLMRECEWLDFQVLTKRAERLIDILPDDWGDGYPNVWLGVSVETQKLAEQRIPLLLDAPAAVRFVSFEPLLEEVRIVGRFGDGPAIDWAIVGLESGPGRRDPGLTPIITLARQCTSLNIPVFIKQDCALKPGQQGRISNVVWNLKQFPKALAAR
jgi:protein gp37